MKSFLIASSAMFIISASAHSGEVLLDASCTIECVTSVNQEVTMNGYRSVQTTQKAYFDVSVGFNREDMDKYLSDSKLQICEKKFGKVISAEKPDCLIFKH